MPRLQVPPLPDLPSAAAAAFFRDAMPEVLALLGSARNGEDLVLIFSPADHTHTAWRLAAVQALAREHAPRRVNAIAGGGEAAVAAALAYLGAAEGVTGQYLPLDDAGAGPVV